MAVGSQDAHRWKAAAIIVAVLAISAGACALRQYRSASALAQRLATVSAASESFRTQLGYAERRATELTWQLAMAQKQLHAESRPDLPVVLGFRDTLLGGGKVATIRNLSGSTLEIIVEAQSPVTGAHFRRSFVISPKGQVQIGKLQGWPFAPGQTITLSNPNYRSLTRMVG